MLTSNHLAQFFSSSELIERQRNSLHQIHTQVLELIEILKDTTCDVNISGQTAKELRVNFYIHK